MRLLSGLALALCAALTGACAHDTTRLSRDCDVQGGWCPQAVRVAGESWQYAQAAQNVYWEQAETSGKYRDQPFVLPPPLKERFAAANDRYGFAYSVFDRYDGERLVEVVLAFRGTEGPIDWWNGNLLGRHGPRGVRVYRLLRAGMDNAGYADVPIVVTGHSLGGRIAARVVRDISMREGEAPTRLSSVLFNHTSRHSIQEPAVDGPDPVHYSVSEDGEIAGLLRAASNEGWDGYVIDCRPGLNPIGGHYMRYLADCLTWVAAREDGGAAESVRRNEIPVPAAEARDARR